jgi:hypothetical protein
MKNPLMLAAVFGLLSSSAAFAVDDGKLNLVCTVNDSFKIPILKSPSSKKITGYLENSAVVTLLNLGHRAMPIPSRSPRGSCNARTRSNSPANTRGRKRF